MAGNEVCAIDVKSKLSTFLFDGSGIIFVTDDKLGVWDIAGNKERFSIPLSPRHTVQEAQSTPDSRLLVVAEERSEADGGQKRHVVALYDLRNPEPVHVFDGHKQPIPELAVSHDGKRSASSSTDGIVKVWDLAAAIAAPSP